MASYTRKSKVSVATGGAVDMNLSNTHISTLDFGTVLPVYANELIPNDSFNVKVSSKAFISPLISPTFSNVKCNYRSIFVPFHTVYNKFYDFLSNNPYTSPTGVSYTLQSVPTLSSFNLLCAFLSLGDYREDGLTPQQHNYSSFLNGKEPLVEIISIDTGAYFVDGTRLPDVEILGSTNWNSVIQNIAYRYYTGSSFEGDWNDDRHIFLKFTRRGRHVLSQLSAIGYELNVSEDYKFSALPLLCFYKALNDWYLPSQYQSFSEITSVLNRVNTESEDVVLTFEEIASLFNMSYLSYNNDYFTSAWETIGAPLEHQVSYLPSHDYINSDDESLSVSTYDSDGANSSLDRNRIPWYGLQLMNQVRNYFTRNFVAGSRAIERMLSRFGIRLNNDVAQISRYCGGSSSVLDISVINDTSSTGLGNYVGRANLSGDCSFSCESGNEYGMFFVFASLYNDASFADGFDRFNLHLSPSDFYTPEFDGKMLQAISIGELCNRVYDGNFNAHNTSDVFGFIPRYAEYKRSIDRLTGDFMLPRFKTTLSQYELFRHLYNSDASDLQLKVSENIDASIPSVLMQGDVVQNDKIFQYNDSNQDNFIFVFQNQVHAKRHMLSADATFEIQGKGNLHEFETNGVRVN